MIHHVGLEITADGLDAELAFWAVLGWPETTIPANINDPARWVARGDQQIHLLIRDASSVPNESHLALVDPDLDATARRIAEAGYELLERRRYWDARRIYTRSPAGHRVEIMSAPPADTRTEAAKVGHFPRGHYKRRG
jgi:catechol 2,3-dioxygenase-like lactoylglutathione lyase family enzyme